MPSAVAAGRQPVRPAPVARPDVLARALGAFPETAWLYVLAGVPLVFSIAQTRNFDLLKALELRAVMLVVVVVAAIEVFVLPSLRRPTPTDVAGVAPPVGRLRRAAIVGAAAILASQALSTVVSLVPRISLVGSHVRNFGLLSEMMHVVLFLALVWRLRHLAQLDRALDLVAAVGTVAAFYGVMQYVGLDPVRETYARVGQPPTATFGNSGFSASFFAASLLVTLGRLAAAWDRHEERADPSVSGATVAALFGLFAIPLISITLIGAYKVSPWWFMALVPTGGLVLLTDRVPTPRWWRREHELAVLALATALQLWVLVLTEARASWIAVAVGVTVFGLRLARRNWVRAAVAAAAGAVMLITATVLVGTMQQSPIASLRSVPVLGSVIPAASRLSVDQRLSIWSDVLAVARSAGTTAVDVGTPRWVRPLAGYGPGTLYLVVEQVASDRRLQVEPGRLDRAHDEYLERLVDVGALGLVAWTVFGGLLLALAFRAVWRASPAVRIQATTVAALLVALMVGDLFGAGDPSTRLVFWFVAGILASACLSAGQESEPAATPAEVPTSSRQSAQERAPVVSSPSRRWVAAPVVAAAVVSLAAAVGAFPTPYYHRGLVVLVAVLVTAGLFGAAWWRAARDLGLNPGRAIVALRPPERAGALGVVVLSALLVFRALLPAEADLYNKAVLLFIDARDYPDAVDLEREAIAISPTEELYFMTLGALYSEIAEVAPDGPNLVRPENALALALGLPVEQVATLTRPAFFDLSAAAFQQALDLDPYDYLHHLNLAKVAIRRAQLGDRSGLPGAEQHLQAAAVLAPKSNLVRQTYADYLAL